MAQAASTWVAPQHTDRINPSISRPDTRRPAQKFFEAIADPRRLAAAYAAMAVALLFYPGLWLPCSVLGLIFYLTSWSKAKRERLPMRLPFTAHGVDYSDPIPGSDRKKFFKAQGIMLLGQDRLDGAQLWAKKGDILTHFMVFGGTGSGKTEVLVSFAAGYLALSSGLAYVDPKAAPKLPFQISSLCRMFWRDHDFRVMNYMTGSKSPTRGIHPYRDSNTSNPFSKGSPENATSILTSLITVGKGDNAVFGQNAQNLMAGLMRGLTERRDVLRMPMDVRVIRDSMASQKYYEIAQDQRLHSLTRDSMMAFLRSVGFVETSPYEKQAASFHQQYGYAQAYYSQPLNALTDSYEYIFGRSMGEVDFEDVIKQRRILTVMLPSLSKSPAELSNLGKVILGGIRNAVSVGLGDHIQGTVAETLDNLPMAAKYPFGAIVDEYAAIATEGFVQVLTQGRGIGISALIGTQDYAGLKHASELEAQQAVENSTIKLFGKTDTGESTFDLLKRAASEMDVASNAGSELDPNGSNWKAQGRASYTKVARVDLQDLQRQIEGEFHVVFRGDIVRAQVFYANPPLPPKYQLRINVMMPVPWPSEREADEYAGRSDEAVHLLQSWIAGGGRPEGDDAQANNEDLMRLATVLDDERHGARERGAAAVALWGLLADRSVRGSGGHSQKAQPEEEPQVTDPDPEDAPSHQDRDRDGASARPRPQRERLSAEDLEEMDALDMLERAVAGKPAEPASTTAADPEESSPEDVADEAAIKAIRLATGEGSSRAIIEAAIRKADYPKPPMPAPATNDDVRKLVEAVRSRTQGAGS